MTGYVLRILRKLPFWRRYTTRQFERWWETRKIDWGKDYLGTWEHPHRHMITAMLRSLNWFSLIEIGCGSGPNLLNIIKTLGRKTQIGGVDINPEAIALANKVFTGGQFRVGSGEDLFLSDNHADVILSDMLLIYVGPRKIKKYLLEMRRVSRKFVVLSEFHSKSWWDRFKLRLFSGHNAYDYQKLLTKYGFTDITIYKYPNEFWQNDPQSKFRHLIVARVPQINK